MRSVGPFPYRKLTAASVLAYRVNESGQIAIQGSGDAPPFSIAKYGRSYEWHRGAGDEWILRTRGAPLTMTNVRAAFGALAGAESDRRSVDERCILVTIACESGPYVRPPTERNLRAPRTEPGYPGRDPDEAIGGRDFGDEARDALDWAQIQGTRQSSHSSHGIMQTLISTAVSAAPRLFAGVPVAQYRRVLWDPKSSIEAGTAYLALKMREANGDPVRLRFAYGAGGVYPQSTNHGAPNLWGARYSWEPSILNWVAYWNDLQAVEAASGGAVAVGGGLIGVMLLALAVGGGWLLWKGYGS